MADLSKFIPVNDLELVLATGLQGRLSRDHNLEDILLGSQMYMAVDRPMEPGIWDPAGQVLMLQSEHGFDVIPLFTSPERIDGVAARFPQFPHRQLVSFSWMLRGLGEGIGVGFNPGSDLGFEIGPDEVRRMKAMLPAEG